jgi:hypothetical protein
LLTYVQRITAEKKIDPLTGELFTPERKNQIFATRENQIKFNNKKNSLKKKKTEEIKSNYPDNMIKLDYASFFNSQPLTQTEAGKYISLGLFLGIILTAIYFITKESKMDFGRL